MHGRNQNVDSPTIGQQHKPAETAALDGVEAVAQVAYKTNEVCIIYPITPASAMGEYADEWATQGKENLWGIVPEVVQMQSEGGAAGSVHGSLQTGALATTFTASQGLLLMIPNMYKIAGELTSTVFHVASRSIAAQGLSIFGDHQDVMATRQTGFAMLCSASVQEAHDMALISQAATLEARVPFIHFFDGFRTSHEINTIELIADEQIAEMLDVDLIHAHRKRALSPEHPVIRGTAQNPDTYFQARETVNPYYAATPDIVQSNMDRFAALTGRQYELCEYYGAQDAERLLIVMGSGADVALETMAYLADQGDNKLGVIKLHLYRPFPIDALLDAIPASTRALAILDRTKEPGARGEPLYKDVVTAMAEGLSDGRLACDSLPKIIGGRFGLSSKDFTPAMVKGVFDELRKDKPKNHFTIGINDDLSHTSLDFDPSFILQQPAVISAMFYGQGSDGTVGANKNTVKIIDQQTDYQAQAYFVYDSKKAGSQTISHLRFGPNTINAPYLIQTAGFISCHLFSFLLKNHVLKEAAHGATFLLNSPYGPEEVWSRLPQSVQAEIIEKNLKFYVIDAYQVAKDNGLGRRISTVMQTCFFAIADVLPREEAIDKIKQAIHKTFIKKGQEIVDQNYQAVDNALKNLHEVEVPSQVTSDFDLPSPVGKGAPEFVQNVLGPMIAGRGDALPVSMLPADGTYPVGTAAWEAKDLTEEVPIWEPEICAQCGNCEIICPHSVIRMKSYDDKLLESAPDGFKSVPLKGRGVSKDRRYTLQVAVENCTGCTLCVAACPVDDPKNPGRRAINMGRKRDVLDTEIDSWEFFQTLPAQLRGDLVNLRMRETQMMKPAFEFSSACSGCGETPYLKLLTQLFGDHTVVANATGCSSIYGGNLPTTPWSTDSRGRGPAWSNSLFEDNAEFGFGFRITLDKLSEYARKTLKDLSAELGEELVSEILNAPQESGTEMDAQRLRLDELRARLLKLPSATAKDLYALSDNLLKRLVWIVGGDGWAYDIGFGGLDHVLASDRDINILVMDTEVYSNTGGQKSKATPRAATAKFATGGKHVAKKDLGMIAADYGHVYVAQIAIGSDPKQTVRALQEAAQHKGPSIVIAYATCIAQGIDLTHTVDQMQAAVSSGYWPLYRYDPNLLELGRNPMQLDSEDPSISFKDFAMRENRYRALGKSNPEHSERLLELAQEDITKRWASYKRKAYGVETP